MYAIWSGLRECHWPGRCHVEKRDGATFYLDSAHTPLSMKVCASVHLYVCRSITDSVQCNMHWNTSDNFVCTLNMYKIYVLHGRYIMCFYMY